MISQINLTLGNDDLRGPQKEERQRNSTRTVQFAPEEMVSRTLIDILTPKREPLPVDIPPNVQGKEDGSESFHVEDHKRPSSLRKDVLSFQQEEDGSIMGTYQPSYKQGKATGIGNYL